MSPDSASSAVRTSWPSRRRMPAKVCVTASSSSMIKTFAPVVLMDFRPVPASRVPALNASVLHACGTLRPTRHPRVDVLILIHRPLDPSTRKAQDSTVTLRHLVMVTAIGCASATVPVHRAAGVVVRRCSIAPARYVEEFQRQLSGIVAEETYLQEVVPVLGMNAIGRMRLQRRRLQSDLLLLRPEGSHQLGAVPGRLRGRRQAGPRSRGAAHGAVPRTDPLGGAACQPHPVARARATTSATSSAR